MDQAQVRKEPFDLISLPTKSSEVLDRYPFHVLLQKLGTEHERLEGKNRDLSVTNQKLHNVCCRMRDMYSCLHAASSSPESLSDLDKEMVELGLNLDTQKIERSPEAWAVGPDAAFDSEGHQLDKDASNKARQYIQQQTVRSTRSSKKKLSVRSSNKKLSTQVVPTSPSQSNLASSPKGKHSYLLPVTTPSFVPAASQSKVTIEAPEAKLLEIMKKKEAAIDKNVQRFENDFVRKNSVGFRSAMDNLDGDSEDKVGPRHQLLRRLVTSFAFDAFIGLVMLLNMIILGIESNHTVTTNEPLPVWTRVVDHSTRVVFLLELCLRFGAFGIKTSLRSPWVRFDMFMVCVSALDWVLLLTMFGEESLLDNFMLIRILRLARLARSLRLMVQFRTIWLLCVALFRSINTLFWTLILICLLTYVFAVVGVELLPPDDSSIDTTYNRVAMESFGSLWQAMVTMFQIMTFDDAAQVYGPLIMHGNPWITVPYFSAFILVAGIALMNLVTAMMVDVSLQQSNLDHEAQKAWETARKRTLIPKLQQMFQCIDADQSGEIELHEIINAPDDLKEALSGLVHFENVHELFAILDYDQSGAVGIDEFLDVVFKVQGEKPVELHCLMKQCAEILKEVREVRTGFGSSCVVEAPKVEPITNGYQRPSVCVTPVDSFQPPALAPIRDSLSNCSSMNDIVPVD